jgi:hypothetical protein
VKLPTFTKALSGRREFLKSFGAGVAVLTSGALAPRAIGAVIGPESRQERRNEAWQVRREAAQFERQMEWGRQPVNRDDDDLPGYIGSFTKGLPHDQFGEVDVRAYKAYIAALKSGDPDDFERIPMGGAAKLANPQAAYTYQLEGADSHQLTLLPAPAFGSTETAGEMAEIYWQAICREVPYNQYADHPLTNQAAEDLSKFTAFKGPKQRGKVTPLSLFRGSTPGELVGPYVSQYLLDTVPIATTPYVQRYRCSISGLDHHTSYDHWLAINQGKAPPTLTIFDELPRFIYNNRTLGDYVHLDYTYQAFLNAALIALSHGPSVLSLGNPYLSSKTQGGFVTFGGPMVLDLVSKVANMALKAAWYQKWLVHRRLRPDAFAARVHHQMQGTKSYPVHPEIMNSSSLDLLLSRNGGCLLPMLYQEGCPLHPAYPAGHAAIAGACSTILKAYFNENALYPNPKVSNEDGTALIAWSGENITVGGELNKLASNISLARDAAGVHWRSDGSEGMRLGEEVAIRLLQEMSITYNEDFQGFKFTRFNGTPITIVAGHCKGHEAGIGNHRDRR